jgi:hypothetical protein
MVVVGGMSHGLGAVGRMRIMVVVVVVGRDMGMGMGMGMGSGMEMGMGLALIEGLLERRVGFERCQRAQYRLATRCHWELVGEGE